VRRGGRFYSDGGGEGRGNFRNGKAMEVIDRNSRESEKYERKKGGADLTLRGGWLWLGGGGSIGEGVSLMPNRKRNEGLTENEIKKKGSTVVVLPSGKTSAGGLSKEHIRLVCTR